MAPPIRCANDGIAAAFRISRVAMACLRMRRSVCVGGMRQGEVDAFVFIGFLRSPEIEIREGNLHAMSGGKVKQVRSHDRVVADLLAMPVFEDQDGRRLGGMDGAGGSVAFEASTSSLGAAGAISGRGMAACAPGRGTAARVGW